MLAKSSATIQVDPGYAKTKECFKPSVGLQASKGNLQGKEKSCEGWGEGVALRKNAHAQNGAGIKTQSLGQQKLEKLNQ